MNHVKVNLKNCFGIKSFNHDFDFSKRRCALIYAPNGTMKTSFANTLKMYSQKKSSEIKDRLHEEKTPIYELKDESGKVIPPESVYVANADDVVKSEDRFSAFLADAALKERYDKIYLELNVQKGNFVKLLKDLSQSSDCESEFARVFSTDPSKPESFLQCLLGLKGELDTKHPLFGFKYNNIFDKDNKVKAFAEKYHNDLKNYFERFYAAVAADELDIDFDVKGNKKLLNVLREMEAQNAPIDCSGMHNVKRTIR